MLVVDDHPVVRQGLRTFLDLQEDITVVGEAADGQSCVDAVLELHPDVVLLDLKMPGSGGVEALHGLRSAGSPARVLVITSFTDPVAVLPAVRAGAAGYVFKDVDPPALAAAIRAVHAGHVLLHPDVARLLAAGDSHSPGHPPHRPRARGPLRARPWPLQPRDRPFPRPVREDRQDPRQRHPLQARRLRTAPRPPSTPSAPASSTSPRASASRERPRGQPLLSGVASAVAAMRWPGAPALLPLSG
ncbi:DNA-binding response regulator [Kutzneria sp. 744]|nr:DNA-binding response regulator [Kutzneria sp. 744]